MNHIKITVQIIFIPLPKIKSHEKIVVLYRHRFIERLFRQGTNHRRNGLLGNFWHDKQYTNATNIRFLF